MAAFFSQIGYKSTGEWKEEIVLFDPDKATAQAGASVPTAVFPDGTPATLVAGPRSARGLRRLADRRRRTPGSPGNIVNRVWSWLLGRGIIHEPDDIRPDNPPQQSRIAGLSGAGVGRRPLRPEARLPPDSELEDLSAFLDSRQRRSPRPTPISRTIRCGGWRRRC